MLAVTHPWPRQAPEAATLAERFAPPPGYTRLHVDPTSFGAWLRELPLLPGRPEVLLYDGRRKRNQSAQAAVIDIDVGDKDLQQCADAVLRLRAEYLWAREASDALCFRATSGDPMPWLRWRAGERPAVVRNALSWRRRTSASASYASFRAYLDAVFTWAGTLSLARDLERVADPARVEPGDVFVQGGSPGHAVLVVDVAESRAGRRVFLLAQSYMPAQQLHVLRNPANSESPWYEARAAGELSTPEWTFSRTDLRRFTEHGCP